MAYGLQLLVPQIIDVHFVHEHLKQAVQVYGD